jgi:hypothetical protein
MPAVDAKPQPALGFLTVLEHPQHGLMGGYLVLNPSGRPLEFHCTAPIKPNRAQQILYGPTLEPYLFGEQIGQALVAKSAALPLVICTDLRPVMAVRPVANAPVALVLSEADASGENRLVARAAATPDASQSVLSTPPAETDNLRTPRLRIDAGHGGGPMLQVFQIGRNRLAVPPERDGDRSEILKRLAGFEDLFDLTEPFGRIREALEEAQRR